MVEMLNLSCTQQLPLELFQSRPFPDGSALPSSLLASGEVRTVADMGRRQQRETVGS